MAAYVDKSEFTMVAYEVDTKGSGVGAKETL